MKQARQVEADIWRALFLRTDRPGRSLQRRLREMIVTAGAEEFINSSMPLPSSRRLAEILKVARNTVTLAYQQLESEGIVYSRQRRGFFLARSSYELRTAAKPASPRAGELRSRILVTPSTQKNIAKPVDWLLHPYPFLYGQFDAETFPVNEWRECVREALSVAEIRDWAPDRIDGDDPQLVGLLKNRLLPRRGIWAEPDEIMITLGAQQAIYIVAELIVGPNTVVGIEDPGYPDARNIFSLRTPHIRPLPVDEMGIIPEAIPEDVEIVFLTPTRQCPTGVSLSPERREKLLNLSEERGVILIEDDYESNYGVNHALRSAADRGHVIYIGSLSKKLAPGLRFGFLVASSEVIREARALRRLILRHPPTNNQRALALFLSLGHFDRLLQRSVSVLEERASILRQSLATHLPEFGVSYSRGGSSVWLQGPEHLDSRRLAERALIHGVLVEPGDVFFSSRQPPTQFLRIGFASISARRIDAGIRMLSDVWRGDVPEYGVGG